jgi:prephenate dehydratase
VLTEFAIRGVNLTRIESRPTGERLGRYMFFFDCAGHVTEARLGEALMGLHRVCAEVRFLGSYPRASMRSTAELTGATLAPSGGERLATQPSPGTSDADYAESAAWLTRLRAGELG